MIQPSLFPSDIPRKRCNACTKEFPCTADYFHRNGARGFWDECKSCRAKSRREYRLRNIEHAKAIERQSNKRRSPHQRKVYRQQESVKEKGRQYTRTYYQREEVQARMATPEFREDANRRYKKHYYTNPLAKIKQNARRRANPAQRRPGDQRRHAREVGAQGSYTYQELMRRYQEQDGKCFYCGVDVGRHFHADHYIPLAKGGSNFIQNIVIACPPCNCSKKDSYPWEWSPRNRLF